MRISKWVSALCAPLMVFGIASGAQAGDLSFFTSVQDTDVATFSIGKMRNVGSGTLSVSGLTGTVSSAYLFWHGPMGTYSDEANAYVEFDGTPIVGTNMGFSDHNNWVPSTNSQTYQADVTSLFTGNGDYALSQFIRGGNGRIANINGASLIVFFDDGDIANNQNVTLFAGNDSNRSNAYDADGWNATLSGIDYLGGAATLGLVISDGQTIFGDGTLMIDGTTIDSGHFADGLTVQQGNGLDRDGNLWDYKTYDIAGFLTPGTNTLSLTNTPHEDALSLVVAQVSVAARATSPVPEPATWAMFIAGFGLAGMGFRRGRGAMRLA